MERRREGHAKVKEIAVAASTTRPLLVSLFLVIVLMWSER